MYLIIKQLREVSIMNILISNDDGVEAPGILAAKEAVEDLADITIVAPQDNNSGVGRHMTLFKHLNVKKYELEDKSLAYGVNGTPTDSVIVGINYLMDKKPDLVITGINTGINISSKDITASGTVCAALEAVARGIPAIAVSMFLDYDCYKQDENGEWYLDVDFELTKKVLHNLVEKIRDKGFPDGVDLFNLNVPYNYESEEVKITKLSDRMLDKKVIDHTDDEMHDIFSFNYKNNEDTEFYEDENNKTVMITSNLVESFEEGTDGHCLMVEKRPSLTPLNVDMTTNLSNLNKW